MQLAWLHSAALLALLAVPALAALLLVRPRARRIAVGSLQFWQDSATSAALEKSRRFERLDLPAILLLAALAALIVAAAGPQLVRATASGPAGLIVIDRSPSLLMTDGGGEGRLARLRRQVDRFLDRLPPELVVAVETSPPRDGTAPLVGPVATLRPALAEAMTVASWPVTDESLWQELLLWRSRGPGPMVLFTDLPPFAGQPDAAGQPQPGPTGQPSAAGRPGAAGQPDSAVHASDAAQPNLANETRQTAPHPRFFRLVATGGSAMNAGLSGAAVTRRDGRPYALLQIHASPNYARKVPLRIDGAGLSLPPQEMAVGPGDQSYTLALPATLPEQLAVTLDSRDDFPHDNQVRIVRREGHRYRVGYAGRPDDLLLRFLQVAGAEVYDLADAGPRPADLDLVVAVDILPPEDYDGPAVLVNPPASVGPLVRTERRGGPGSWAVSARADALALNLPPRGPAIGQWPIFELNGAAEVVMTARAARDGATATRDGASAGDSAAPLVVRYRGAGGPRVAVLFSIEVGNTRWAYEPSFVIFWAHCLKVLASRAAVVERYEPATLADGLMGAVAGRRSTGPAVDETDLAVRDFLAHGRQMQPAVLSLWPMLAGLALVLMLLRMALLR